MICYLTHLLSDYLNKMALATCETQTITNLYFETPFVFLTN